MGSPAGVDDVLDADRVAAYGYFEPKAVAGLVRRARRGQATGFRENQAIVAVLSTQLWHQQFLEGSAPAPLPAEGADVLMNDATVLADR